MWISAPTAAPRMRPCVPCSDQHPCHEASTCPAPFVQLNWQWRRAIAQTLESLCGSQDLGWLFRHLLVVGDLGDKNITMGQLIHPVTGRSRCLQQPKSSFSIWGLALWSDRANCPSPLSPDCDNGLLCGSTWDRSDAILHPPV